MSRVCNKCGTSLFDGQYECPICMQRAQARNTNRIQKDLKKRQKAQSRDRTTSKEKGPLPLGTVAIIIIAFIILVVKRS